jgi:hypothetical protein
MSSVLDLLPTDRINEFEVVLAGDHIGYVWYDEASFTWVATEDRDVWGTDGFDDARDAAEYLIYS